MDERLDRLIEAVERLVEVMEEIGVTLREIVVDTTNIDTKLDEMVMERQP